MINNKDNITNNNNSNNNNNNYYCRNNANKRKLRDFICPKIKTSIY